MGELAWQATAEGGFWAGDEIDQQEARRQRIGLMTGDEQCARLLMSVPAVRAAALSLQQPPFFIDGNRLVVSDLSPSGASAAEVERVMAGLAELVPALPWPELAGTASTAPGTGRRSAAGSTSPTGSR